MVVALLLAPAAARAATYYAGPTGCSDSGPGSQSQPFCSLQTGVDKLKAGDTLLILAGTFKEEQVVVGTIGTAASPVTIAAAPGAKPILDGSGGGISDTGLLYLLKARYVTVRGLTMRSSPYWGILVESCQNVVLDQVKVDISQHGGLIVANTTAIQITGSEINRANDAGWSIHEAFTLSNVQDFVVSGNWVHHGKKEGIDAKDGTKNGKIIGNHVHNTVAVPLYLNNASNVEVSDNNVHDTEASGIQLATGDGASGTNAVKGNKIFRNRFWNNKWNGVEFWVHQSGEMSGNLIYNNVFYGNGSPGVALTDDGGVVKGNTIRNNIFMKNGGGISGDTGAQTAISHNLFFQSGGAVGSSNVSQDPLFVNAAAGDFHLKAGSPAIDKGFDMGLPKVGTALDIGAFEYGQVGPAPDLGPGKDGPAAKKDLGPARDGPFLPGGERPPPPLGDNGLPIPGAEPSAASLNTLTGGCGCALASAEAGELLLGLALLGLLSVLRLRRRPA